MAFDVRRALQEGYSYSEIAEYLADKRKFNLAKGQEERPIIDRLTLHAAKLTFEHPTTGQEMTFSADAPKDFQATLQVLRKYAAPYASAFDAEFF